MRTRHREQGAGGARDGERRAARSWNPPGEAPGAAGGATSWEERVEDYLDRLEAVLRSRVPLELRQQVRGEVRDHLLSRAEAYQELGSAPDEAVREALRQFGEPDAVGRRWLRAWRQGAGQASARPAALVGLGAFGAAVAVCLGVLALTHGDQLPWLAQRLWAWIALVSTAAPLTAGLAVGLTARSRPVAGALLAVGALAITSAALAITSAALGGFVPVELPPYLDWSGLALTLALFWLPIGGAAAALGGWLRRRTRSRRERLPV